MTDTFPYVYNIYCDAISTFFLIDAKSERFDSTLTWSQSSPSSPQQASQIGTLQPGHPVRAPFRVRFTSGADHLAACALLLLTLSSPTLHP